MPSGPSGRASVCGLSHAASRGWVGPIEPRDDFARPAPAGDPPKVVVHVDRLQVLIGDQDAEPVRSHTASHRALAARCQGISIIHGAVGKLHIVAASVSKAPMLAIAF